MTQEGDRENEKAPELRRFYDDDDELVVEIPDDCWRCPRCGIGYEKGLGLIHDHEHPKEGRYFAAEEVYCCKCNNYCCAEEVYAEAVVRRDHKTCSLCEGEGHIPKTSGRVYTQKQLEQEIGWRLNGQATCPICGNLMLHPQGLYQPPKGGPGHCVACSNAERKKKVEDA